MRLRSGRGLLMIRCMSQLFILCIVINTIVLLAAIERAEANDTYARLLGKHRGSYLAIDVATGREIARYDADGYLGRPFVPGSLMKIFITVTGLETGSIDPDRKIYCGRTMDVSDWKRSCWNRGGHGILDVRKAIAYSCNHYFAAHAGYVRYQDIVRYLKMYGLVDKIPELPVDEQMRTVAGVGTALRVTPETMLRAVADIFREEGRRVPLRNETIDVIRDGMKMSVEFGTSKKAGDEAGTRNMLGKTGTAMDCRGRKCSSTKTHGWWVGMYPASRPEIAVIVFLPEGQGAGDAAPAGGRIMKRLLSEIKH